MLALFTPFITGDIQCGYGYVFAGCNLGAFVVVYFFLMESSGRTLEEVDAMYLLQINSMNSAKYEFDEETKATLGRDINNDAMHLHKRGRGFTKAEEGGRGGVLHYESKPPTAFPKDIHDISNDRPMTSSGGIGEDKS